MILAIAPTVVIPAASLVLNGAAPALHACVYLSPRLQVLDAQEQRLLGERQERSDDLERERADLRGPRCAGFGATRPTLPAFAGRGVKWALLPL